jgi:ribosomal protein S5
VTPGGRQVEHVSTVVPGDGAGQIGHAASAQLIAQPLDAGTQKACIRELVVPDFTQEV